MQKRLLKKWLIAVRDFLINLLHLNMWEYYDLVEDPPRYDFDGPYYRKRRCKITRKHQQRINDWLGGNPDRYYSHWHTCHYNNRLN